MVIKCLDSILMSYRVYSSKRLYGDQVPRFSMNVM